MVVPMRKERESEGGKKVERKGERQREKRRRSSNSFTLLRSVEQHRVHDRAELSADVVQHSARCPALSPWQWRLQLRGDGGRKWVED